MRTRIVIRNVSLAALVVACVIAGLVYVIPVAAGAIRPGPAAPLAGPAVPPRIGGVSPATAPASSTINITGAGFLLTRAVAIGGTPASFRIMSPFLIQAVVPRTAGPGLITVTTNYGTAKSPKRFIVSPSIWFNLPYGPPTTNVTVSGSGFGLSEQVAVVFGGTALPLAPTDSKGVFPATPYQVPVTALPGTQAVTALGQTSGLSASASFLVNTDWATMHDDLTRSGLNPYENVLSSGNVSGLTKAWSFATGSFVDSSAAEVDGVVYIGSEDFSLYALNATTGALLWSFPTGGFVESPPAVANGVVYFGSDDNHLYALNATTGALLWSFPASGQPALTGNVETSPAVVGGVVYFGSDDQNVYALNATTGALLWSFKTGGIVGASPAVVGGVVYVGSGDKNVYALDAATGTLKWSTATGGFIDSSVAVANGVVYVGTFDFNLYALNASTGTVNWTFKTQAAITATPAVSGNIVYVGSEDKILYALDATNQGALLWTGSTQGAIFSSPAVASDVVYVGSDDNKLYAYNAAGCGTPTCAALWSFTTFDLVVSSPAVANGMVFVGSDDFSVYAFKLPPPGTRPHRPPRLPPHSPPRLPQRHAW
jgi:outer membrane protein assembly factor BamB